MGYRVLLIAVSGKTPEAVHKDFGVTPSGRFEEIAESPVTGAPLPDGGYLLYINDGVDPEAAGFARLSKGGSLLTCHVNETVMHSQASAWVNGVEQWSVTHDAQQGQRHLETTGTLPPEYPAIRDRLLALKEGGVDYVFDIPVELFAALGGIRYDQDIPGAGPEPWQVLDRKLGALSGKHRIQSGKGCLPLIPWLLLPLVPALMAAVLYILQGGTDGGHGPYDQIIYFLGQPGIWFLLHYPGLDHQLHLLMPESDWLGLLCLPALVNLILWGLLATPVWIWTRRSPNAGAFPGM